MNFFAELIKYLGSPTRGKWLVLFALVVLGVIFLIGYERHTATFRLSRLQKETELLARLQDMQMRGTNAASPELNQLRSVLLANATRTIQEKPISMEFVPSKLTFSFDSLLKCIFGGSMWLCFAIFSLRKIKTKEGQNTAKGLFILAVFSGIVGLFVPPIWWPWFHIFIFPWLLIIIAALALLPFAIVTTNFQTAKKVATANACHNNLRQIDAAKYQWALENNKDLNALPTELDLKMYLKNGIAPKCPSGGTYAINSVGRPPSCSFAGHDLHFHEGAFAAAKRKAKAINCKNNLKQVGLAAKIWSCDHNDHFPEDFDSMKAELGSDKITHCSAGECAKYAILSPGISSSDPTAVYAKCPIHDHVVLVDGSVHELKNRQLIQKDGKWFIES